MYWRDMGETWDGRDRRGEGRTKGRDLMGQERRRRKGRGISTSCEGRIFRIITISYQRERGRLR